MAADAGEVLRGLVYAVGTVRLCSLRRLTEEDFPDDRVQTVRISMAEEEWASLVSNVMAEEDRKADISIDGELVEGHGVKKINLDNGFSDPTLMREFLGYELMAAAGVYTPRRVSWTCG